MVLERGFTLVEMMITIALAAILISVAVPSLNQFATNARQTGATNDFVATIHIARSMAITTNARVTICASSGGSACEAVSWDQGWIAFSDANSNQLVDGNDAIVSSGEGIEGVNIQSGEFGQALQYRPNGRIAAGAGHFTICDRRGADHAKVIVMDLSGRPRLSSYRADGTSPNCA
jgi:type IV fimbrial biogenesis protein FimT